MVESLKKRSTTTMSTTASKAKWPKGVLPPELDLLTYKNAKDKVEFGMEVDEKARTTEQKEPAHVAQFSKVDDGTKCDLKMLRSDQIWKLALNFG
jgi:hypothetical protein